MRNPLPGHRKHDPDTYGIPLPWGICVLLVSFDDDADYVEYTSDELGGNFSEKLIYNFNITSVTIDIGGQSMPLNEALRDGFITEEEIFCRRPAGRTGGILRGNL